MTFREALITDYPQLHFVRNAVRENVLSDPNLVTCQDYEDYISRKGKGWVCEIDSTIVGFSIISLTDRNVWALFLLPEYEGRGIGKELHRLMLDWYFGQTSEPVWLSTEQNSRAEKFYRLQGWAYTGPYQKNESRFEMTADSWQQSKTG